jgi:hypothetical protein
MRQIERDCKPKHAVRTEEFLREVNMRARRNIAGLKLAIQPPDPALYQGPLDADRKISQACGKESPVVGILQG